MYTFEKYTFEWLVVHKSTPSKGDTHVKMYSSSAKPSEQRTLNIYVKGSFSWTCGKHKQILFANDSNLAITLPVIQEHSIIVEKALEDNSVRLCIQPKEDNQRWKYVKYLMEKGETIKPQGLIILPFETVTVLSSYTSPKRQLVFIASKL